MAAPRHGRRALARPRAASGTTSGAPRSRTARDSARTPSDGTLVGGGSGSDALGKDLDRRRHDGGKNALRRLDLAGGGPVDALPHARDRPQRPRHVAGPHARLARHAGVVAHALLDDPEVPLARLRDQLRVDEEIGALDRELVDHLAPEELERAVDVTHPDAEQEPDDP